ncbi:G-protein coupled receptor 143-like isoform X2 [Daktulosphaira vitifoliae]|nr:G-protein coupled receptor 143-like isoform X2 [Daktulosphaira vitifoliae]XP_050532274.1 G-protein coupled receptor 143-like isoform X2 [Daktulosphaira vitifoliae]XP_050532275.1 G-protein coupled receptor 143-like isoform X2 [Daktulosphaira vitifoliae]
MADPSIQTFCCQRPLNYHSSYKLMNEFNTDRFNMVCLVSSLIGVFGATYQLLPRMEISTVPNRFYSSIMQRGKYIVMWLAFADCSASLGILLRSSLKLMHHYQWYDDQPYTLMCVLLAGWIQYFCMVTWVWTLLYAVDMWRAFQDKYHLRKIYHLIAWLFPAVFTFFGLSLLYNPNTNCYNMSPSENAVLKFFPNYLLTFIPIISVMIANPILYGFSTKYIYHIITSYMAQYSTKERKILDLFKTRFFFMNLGFYLCWGPNLINAIIVWTSWDNLPAGLMLTLWYLMAFLNPMQAFFNTILYNMLEHIENLNCKPFPKNKRVQEVLERRPLLLANVKGSSNSHGYDIID